MIEEIGLTKEESRKLGERMKADLRELRRLGKLPGNPHDRMVSIRVRL
jgi:hypothetical protein